MQFSYGGPAGVDSAAELHTPAQPRRDVDVEEIVRQLHVSEVRRLRHQVRDLAEFARADVVQAAHLIAAAVRQARIGWRGHAEGTVVGRRHRQVVGDREVAEPVVVVAAGDRDARRGARAALRRRYPSCTGRAANPLVTSSAYRVALGLFLPKLTFWNAPHSPLPAGFCRLQSGKTLPFGVVPRAGDAVHAGDNRVHGGREDRGFREDVPAERHPAAPSGRCRTGRTTPRRAG